MGNKLFNSPEPKPITDAGFYGFNWQPNLNNYNSALDGITSPKGIIVGFNQASFDEVYFGTNLLYKLPSPSTRLKNIANQIFGKNLSNDVKIKEVQGFLDYTNACLNYIYQTIPGKKLLTQLQESTQGVAIIPSIGANEIRSGEGSLSIIAKFMLDPSWRSVGDSKNYILSLLAKASKVKGDGGFEWLAKTINKTPLYNLEDKSPYPFSDVGFLNKIKKTVSSENIKDWFTAGDESSFAKKLQLIKTKTDYKVYKDKITVEEFIQLATIIALWPQSTFGLTRGSTISFNVRVSKDPSSETGYLNSQRPPAIGLAHELIHALHSQIGNQPGKDFGANSTTLYELLCVGIGPWDGYPISENAIRAEWSGVVGLTGYNNMKVAKREYYIDDTTVKEAEKSPSLVNH